MKKMMMVVMKPAFFCLQSSTVAPVATFSNCGLWTQKGFSTYAEYVAIHQAVCHELLECREHVQDQ